MGVYYPGDLQDGFDSDRMERGTSGALGARPVAKVAAAASSATSRTLQDERKQFVDTATSMVHKQERGRLEQENGQR